MKNFWEWFDKSHSIPVTVATTILSISSFVTILITITWAIVSEQFALFAFAGFIVPAFVIWISYIYRDKDKGNEEGPDWSNQ